MIVWITRDTGEVFERRYSFRFCRKMSERLTGEKVIDVDPEETLGGLRNLLPEDEDVLIVDDPETVIPRVSLHMMRETLKRSRAIAVGPVMNVSAHADQTAQLPFRYLDLATFREAAEAMAQNHGEKSQAVTGLDPSCIPVSAGFWSSVPPVAKISEVAGYLDRDLQISRGALIHRFSGYFSSGRADLAGLVPQHARKVLDLGCARGEYGRTLKREKPDIHLVGVELYPELARHAEECYDQVMTGTIEEIALPGDFDVINMGDILEHLRDPWENLAKMYSLLNPGGCLVGSVPNIGHWTIVRNLCEGNFEYIPFGLLCVGHLRFFTEKTLVDSLEEAGFSLDILEREQIPPTPRGAEFIRKVTQSGWGDRTSLMTNELIFRAKKESR